LDPNHIPGLERTSDPTTGQSIRTSVSSSTELREDHPTSYSSQGPSWKGAWKRRQEAKIRAARLARGLDSDEEEGEEGADSEDEGEKGDGKIPIPPIPDLRYEQGILSSIKPFLHSASTDQSQNRRGGAVPKETVEHEEKLETVEKTVLASSQLTAGQGREQELETGRHQSEALMGPLRIEWGMVSYVLFRDQVSLSKKTSPFRFLFSLCLFNSVRSFRISSRLSSRYFKAFYGVWQGST